MTTEFDPYRKWLGIPASEQPANHYRLLGIGLFEDDPDVIDNAADRQMAHVQTYRTGKHSQLTQRLLNELSAAKLCLLNTAKKSTYDGQLRATLAPSQPSAAPLPIAQAAIPVAPLAEGMLPPAAGVPLPQHTGVPQTSGSAVEPQLAAAPNPLGASGQSVVVASPKGAKSIRARKRRKDLILYAASFSVALIVLGIVYVAATSSRDAGDDPSGSPAVAIENPVGRNGAKQDAAKKTVAAGHPSDHETEPERTNIPKVDTPQGTDEVSPQPDPTDKSEIVRPMWESTEPSHDQTAPYAIVWKQSPFTQTTQLRSLVPDAESASRDFPAAETAELTSKSAFPSNADRQQALGEVRDVFQDEYAQANSSAKKLSLAKQLYQTSTTEAREATRFVLLAEAHQLALAAGHPASATRIANHIARFFETDQREFHARLLDASARSLPADTPQLAVAVAGLIQVENAARGGNFDLATTLLESVKTQTDRTNHPILQEVVKSFSNQLPKLNSQYDTASEAIASLRESPSDAQASLTAGSYFCFVLDDWKQGLPLLAQGSDPALKMAATADLESPLDANRRAEVGDRWWGLMAENAKQGGEESRKLALQERAVHWYELAGDQLAGLAKERVQNRLKSLHDSGKPDAIGEIPRTAQRFAGTYILHALNPKSGESRSSVWQLHDDLSASENGDTVGRWHASDGTNLKITFNAEEMSPVFLRSRGAARPMLGSRSLPGAIWKWEFLRFVVSGKWEHKTDSITVFGREIPGETETLTFYSNLRVNDPLGPIVWQRKGRNLVISWGSQKNTVATLSPDGTSYAGKTTRSTGFRRTTLTFPTHGRQINGSE